MRWKFWLSSNAPTELMPSVIEAPENLYGLKRNTRPQRVKRRDGVCLSAGSGKLIPP